MKTTMISLLQLALCHLVIVFFLIPGKGSIAQNVVVSDDPVYLTGHPSAVLDIYSDSKGVLVPRVTYTERNAFSNLAQGLLVYQTDSLSGFYYYDGVRWIQLSSTEIKSLSDADNDSRIEVEATPDEDRILFSVRDSARMVIDSNGNIGIGTAAPEEKIHLQGGNLLLEAWGNPKEIGYYNNVDEVNDVCISGNYAFVDDVYTLRIINISNPREPNEVGSINTGSGIYSVATVGKSVYLGTAGGLKIIDISNISSPGISSELPINFINHTCVAGNYAYMAAGSLGMVTVDVTDPIYPVIIDTCNTPGSASKVFTFGEYAYVSDGFTIRIIDIRSPGNIIEKSYINIGETCHSVYVTGNLAYIACHSAGLYIYKVSDPTSPELVGYLDTPGIAKDVYISSDYCYLAEMNGLRTIDISDPASPFETGFFQKDGLTDIRSLDISGKYAFLAAHDDGLRIIDISGIKIPAINSGSIHAGNANYYGNVDIVNNLNIGYAINVGTGGIQCDGNISCANEIIAFDCLKTNWSIRIREGGWNPVYYSRFTAADQSQDLNYTLPYNYGSSNQALITNGLGQLYWGSVVSGGGNTGNLAFWNGSTSLTSDNQLFWDNSNKRLGIGTTSPSGKLHIKGTENVEQLIIQANATQSNYNPLIQFQDSNGNEICWFNANSLNNIFLGTLSGQSTTGSDNTFMGYASGQSNNSGSNNTGIGKLALGFNTSGENNVAVGEGALQTNTTGSNNVGIGIYANVGANNYSNSIAIGANTTTTASNQVRLGDANISTFYCKGAYTATVDLLANMVVTSDGKIQRRSGTKRLIGEVADYDLNSSNIYSLKPVSYLSLYDGSKHYGLIADHVAAIMPELVQFTRASDISPDGSPDEWIPDMIDYPLLTAMIIEEMKALRQKIMEQEQQISELRLLIKAEE